jgi:hypothetical protein
MATKKTIITKDTIVSFYMDYVLENGEKPKSVYSLKLNGFTEADFMTFRHYRKFRKEIFKIF